jgi:sn-glycerol 3-phosphate transport system ATP-binding protein
VTLGLRPEHLGVAGDGPAPLSLAVEWSEALGADTIVHGRLADGTGLTARVPGSLAPAAGDRLPLAPAPGALHLFDAATGRRLEPDTAGARAAA